MSTSKLALVAGALCVSLVAGCASGPNPDVTSRAPDVDLIPTANAPRALLKNAPTRAVHFGFDLDTLDAEAVAELNAQAAWMRANPEVRFSVTGHADRVGSTSYNHDLGMRRASRVVDFLVNAGVASERLERLVSFGEDKPVVDVEGPERLNRRVTIAVSAIQPASVVNRYRTAASRFFVPDDDDDDRTAGWGNIGGASQGPGAGFVKQDGQGNSQTETETAGGSEQQQQTPQGSSSENNSGKTQTATGADQNNTTTTTGGAGSETSEASTETPPGKSGDKPTRGPSNPPGKPDSSASASTNPSNDRLDAGRGNGSEGGDPGQSEGKNQGGDEPVTEGV